MACLQSGLQVKRWLVARALEALHRSAFTSQLLAQQRPVCCCAAALSARRTALAAELNTAVLKAPAATVQGERHLSSDRPVLLVHYQDQKHHEKDTHRLCLPAAELCGQARLLGLTGEAAEAGGQLAQRQAAAAQQLQSAAAAATLPAFQAALQAARQLQVAVPAVTTAEATFAARTSRAVAQLQAAASSHGFAAYWEARCAAVQLVRTQPASAASCMPCLTCWRPSSLRCCTAGTVRLLVVGWCRPCRAALAPGDSFLLG